MNLQQFCIENSFPLTKTSRLLRKTVFDISDARSKRKDFREIELDCSIEEAGLHVRKPKGHKRIQYIVTDDQKLLAFVVARLHFDALTEADIRVLVAASSFLMATVQGENDWRLVQRENGISFKPNEEYFQNLRSALRKSGAQQ